MPPQWSTTHSMAMYTDYSLSSAHNSNAQLLDFDAAACVVNIPVHNMKFAFSNNLHHAKAPTPQPGLQTKHNACQTLSTTINDGSFNAAKSAAFFISANATLVRCHLSPATPMVFRNSFDALSIALDDEEDNIKALMTFLSSPTTTVPSHVSSPPQHIKTSIRDARHSIPSPSYPHHLPRNHLPLLEQDPTDPPWRTAVSHGHKNGTVFNSYLQKNYGRNCHSSKDSYNPTIPCNFCKSPGSTTPCSTHFCIHLCDDPHLVSQHTHGTAPHPPPHGTCMKLLST